MKEYKVYFHNFWPGFMEDEQNNVRFYKKLFNSEKSSLVIKDNPEDADIIIGASNNTLKTKKVYILVLSEPHHTYDLSGSDILFGGITEFRDKRAIFIPAFFSYLYSNDLISKSINRPIRKTVPPNFCCILSSNPKVQERTSIFNILNSYKQVASAGLVNNNVGFLVTDRWGSDKFYQFISQFKFVIATENTKIDSYIQEKLFNGYFSQSIPIYWGSDYVTEIFNKDSMILLKEHNPYNLQLLLQEVIALDTNDEEWLRRVNMPIYRDGFPEYFSLDKTRERLFKKLEENGV